MKLHTSLPWNYEETLGEPWAVCDKKGDIIANDLNEANAAFIVCTVNSRQKLIDLIERFAEFDCFQPWGVSCNDCISGEKSCESCEAKNILKEENHI